MVPIRDNGRGVPIDPHPKYPDKSALEVIFCITCWRKIFGKAYQTWRIAWRRASVVNALSSSMVVQVAHNKELMNKNSLEVLRLVI